MKTRTMAVVLGCLAAASSLCAAADDWPQWRGPNRDAKAVGFKAPATWPPQLTQKWKVTVGDGVATPALVGDKLYTFSRQEGQEVIRCLDAATGNEVWQVKYEAADAEGAAARFPVLGPRSSPAVADGKVVTLGTRGTLCCVDAATGKELWRKDDFHAWPQFFAACSPLIVDGLCVVSLGGENAGAIVAYDLATGNEKWKWSGDGPAYASPVLATVGGARAIITPTKDNLVAVNVTNGELLWKVAYRQGRYNAATPIVDGDTLIYAGPTSGVTAEKLTHSSGKLAAEKLWSNPDNSLIYNTPVLKNGLLFGISTTNNLFCVSAETGRTAWSTSVGPASAEGGQRAAGTGRGREGATSEAQPARGQQPGERQQGRGRRGGGRGGNDGYGSVVDAGDILLALTPTAELRAFKAIDEGYTEVAKYKVAEGLTFSYPVVAGNRIFIKDKDSVTLWTVE